MIRVFIGYDPREAIAFHVLSHSIVSRCSVPVNITPLRLDQLRAIHARAPDPLASTEFAFTRFLTPRLCGFQGWAVYMDCDMLMLDDLARLWELRDDRYAVQVVKHEHNPPESTKFLGNIQTRYAMKNWSSLMLFNNSQCQTLSPEYVDSAPGLDLHRFAWLESASRIGSLPKRWNYLVGYDSPDAEVSNVHFTQGGPYFAEYADCPYSAEWFQAYQAMKHAEQSSLGAR